MGEWKYAFDSGDRGDDRTVLRSHGHYRCPSITTRSVSALTRLTLVSVDRSLQVLKTCLWSQALRDAWVSQLSRLADHWELVRPHAAVHSGVEQVTGDTNWLSARQTCKHADSKPSFAGGAINVVHAIEDFSVRGTEKASE